MNKTVIKFGGSNLKRAGDINKIIKVIRSYKKPVIIIVSAFYGITDDLYEILDKAKSRKCKTDLLTKPLFELKEDVLSMHIEEEDARNDILKKVDERIGELERYLLGINCIGEVPDFLIDRVLSYGERLSSLLLTSILQYNGTDCEEVLPEDIKLITDGEYGNATVDFAASEENVRKRLSEDKTYVIPGFYGVSKDGKVTLLGRGGSDYSAASIARCLNAESLDIWKDVDGFLSADPDIVSDPVRLERITYAEAAELAYFGARILHPRTVEPLMDNRIPVKIFNIDNVGDGTNEPQSVVNSDEVIVDGVIKSVTYSDDIALLKLKGPGVGIKPGILSKVTTQLGKEGINIKSVITSQIAINFLLSKDDLQKAFDVTGSLNLPAVSEILPVKDISIIAVVGQGMLEQHGIAARLFNAVAEKGINIEISSLGASQVVTYIIVRKDRRDEAIRVIHNEFFANRNNDKISKEEKIYEC